MPVLQLVHTGRQIRWLMMMDQPKCTRCVSEERAQQECRVWERADDAIMRLQHITGARDLERCVRIRDNHDGLCSAEEEEGVLRLRERCCRRSSRPGRWKRHARLDGANIYPCASS